MNRAINRCLIFFGTKKKRSNYLTWNWPIEWFKSLHVVNKSTKLSKSFSSVCIITPSKFKTAKLFHFQRCGHAINRPTEDRYKNLWMSSPIYVNTLLLGLVINLFNFYIQKVEVINWIFNPFCIKEGFYLYLLFVVDIEYSKQINMT